MKGLVLRRTHVARNVAFGQIQHNGCRTRQHRQQDLPTPHPKPFHQHRNEHQRQQQRQARPDNVQRLVSILPIGVIHGGKQGRVEKDNSYQNRLIERRHQRRHKEGGRGRNHPRVGHAVTSFLKHGTKHQDPHWL